MLKLNVIVKVLPIVTAGYGAVMKTNKLCGNNYVGTNCVVIIILTSRKFERKSYNGGNGCFLPLNFKQVDNSRK